MLFINIFSNVKQTYIHIRHIQAHFSCRTTIAYDKSVFLFCQDIFLTNFFFPEWMERQTIRKAAKQGGRRNATEKQQVMLT